MKSFDKLPVGVQALVALLSLVVAGLIYHANKLLWVGVWAILPFASYVLIRRMRLLDDHLTEKGMKTLHIWCTIGTDLLASSGSVAGGRFKTFRLPHSATGVRNAS